MYYQKMLTGAASEETAPIHTSRQRLAPTSTITGWDPTLIVVELS